MRPTPGAVTIEWPSAPSSSSSAGPSLRRGGEDACRSRERVRARSCAAPTVGTGRETDLLEITRKDRLSREEAANRLRALADQLARHNDIEFERAGTRFVLRVPDEIAVKVELEVGDETELEIELSW